MPADRGDRLKRTARILARQRFMSRTIAISQVQLEWYRSLSGSDANRLVVVPNGVVDPGPVDAAARARRRAARGVGGGAVLARRADHRLERMAVAVDVGGDRDPHA